MTMWRPPPPIKIEAENTYPVPGFYVRAVGKGIDIVDDVKYFGELSLARKHSCLLVQQFLIRSEEVAGLDCEIQIVLIGTDRMIRLVDSISLLVSRNGDSST